MKSKNRLWLFSKNRKQVFIVIDTNILFLFIVSTLYLHDDSNITSIERISPVLGMFFLMGVFNGIEEYVNNKRAKAYYHEWLGTLIILIAFLNIFVMEH
ncbi:DUF4181 domain-containing protein [Cytobacillus oceanisediminis]|uniref:DUF4181 domain-containing protein n=1 Tax=Cytobacillus oceanisediminis TaxID=665099 RepID=UPI000D712FA0